MLCRGCLEEGGSCLVWWVSFGFTDRGGFVELEDGENFDEE